MSHLSWTLDIIALNVWKHLNVKNSYISEDEKYRCSNFSHGVLIVTHREDGQLMIIYTVCVLFNESDTRI